MHLATTLLACIDPQPTPDPVGPPTEPTEGAILACAPLPGAPSPVSAGPPPPPGARNQHVRDVVYDPVGDRIYVAGEPGLWVLDTSGAAPVTVAELTPGPPGRSFVHLALAGDHMYALDDVDRVWRLALRDDPPSAGMIDEVPGASDITATGFVLTADQGAAAVATDDGTLVLGYDRVDLIDGAGQIVARTDLPEAAWGALDLAWDDVSGAIAVAAGDDGTYVVWPDGRAFTLPTRGSAIRAQAGGGIVVVTDIDGVSVIDVLGLVPRVIAHKPTPSFAVASALDLAGGRLWVGDFDHLLGFVVDLDALVPVAVVPTVAGPDGTVEILNAGGAPLAYGTPGVPSRTLDPWARATLVPTNGCVVTSDADRGVTEVLPPGTDTAWPVGAPALDVEVIDATTLKPVSLASTTWASSDPPLATMVVFWASW